VTQGNLLDDAVERVALSEHAGLSGAPLERVRLADGRVLIVKRFTAETDITLAATGGEVGWEHVLWQSGALEQLPIGVNHAIVDTWVEDDETVIVMRDLGAAMLTWENRLDAARCSWLVEHVGRLHRHFLGHPPDGLAPLEAVLALFAPQRIKDHADIELFELALRGWEIFEDAVPADVAEPVLRLLDDMDPLTKALQARPMTLVHGDLAVVNMAVELDDLVLIDWAMPAAAPGALDITRFIAGCSSVVELSREEMLAVYEKSAGPAYDETAMRLALLASLTWLGWNKALDAAENPDPAIRARERADLEWWVTEARKTLESGAI
jgi:dihydroxyacetone kinase DhaKLM complex PTS-EIIA-like component DhaM